MKFKIPNTVGSKLIDNVFIDAFLEKQWRLHSRA